MFVTLSGITTLVSVPDTQNAFVPMLVTGKPLVLAGMTSVPEPVNPVRVITPLLVVKLNWAFTASGRASSSAPSRPIWSQWHLVFFCLPALPYWFTPARRCQCYFGPLFWPARFPGAQLGTAPGAPVSDPASIEHPPETRRIGDRRSARSEER